MNHWKIFLPAILLLTLVSCRTSRPGGLGDISFDADTLQGKKPFLLAARSIDSVDQTKIFADVWKIEAQGYPDEIKIFARVMDSSGNFVTHMAPPVRSPELPNLWTSLVEKIGRKTQKIGKFSVREVGEGDSIPYAIAHCMDYSGSMNGVLDAIYEGTEIFVGMKKSYDKIAITTFNKDFDVKVPLTGDRNEILSQFRKNRERGFGMYSALYDGIKKSSELLAGTPADVPKVLVVFSDGEDNYSQTKIADVAKYADSTGVHIFTVGFGYTNDTTLAQLADFTGGRFYRAYTKKDLIAIFQDIYRSLRAYYLITYRPPQYAGWHNVTLGINAPKRSDTVFAFGKYDKSDINWRTAAGDAFTKPILFDYNQAVIRPESMYLIEEIADAMEINPRVRLEIQGHTDNVGGEEFNQKLADTRADAVVKALLARGIEQRRLRAKGFGMSQPVAPNDTEENRQKNRRTVFRIIAQ